MAHASQERYSALVDAKLRATLVTRDNTIFNNRYEGSPKAGKVKIPVRDTEVAVKAYDKANGVDADAGTTTYLDLDIDNDEAVNEIIDGFDAASVPDDITAERLDSAGYSMALSIDKKSIEALQGAEGANISATKTACTVSTAYKEALAAKRTLSRNGVPQAGRWMIVSPEYLEILMQDDRFIKQGDLSQQLVQTGAVGQIAGFAVYESNNMDFENTTRVASKKTTTEFISATPTGATASWSGRPRCTCRIWAAPASTSAHPLCRGARCTASRCPSPRPCTSSASRRKAMLYCTYDQYAAAGGTVPEAAFGVLCSRASRMIDAATFGRAEHHAAGCEDCRQMLADACAQIVDLFAAQAAVGAVPGAASVSNDGYSVTFGSNASVTAATRQEAYEIIRTALGNDPHDLLYRGLD